ncbi:S-layer homology domain-containing protein [Paenisporosarcina indica]|uniref:S-layer homology domain-containing protein n=1 Tax=Paenisporosarcina indica TaxID=650093 RepID=UPI00094FD6B0|nr:S-layer homology domain-containing protein [Paenisporosarcina indica]
MKKDSRTMKTIKGLMVGTIALTPVLAVGVNAEKTSAATIDEVAGKLASGYASLNADQKIVFNIVLANLHQYMGDFIQTDYKASLTPNMQALVAPFKYTSETQLKSELTARFNTFIKDAPDGLSDKGTVAELLVYIQNVTGELVQKADTVNRTNLNAFYESLLSILKNGINSAPQGVLDILQVPANSGAIISKIQKDVDDIFAPPGPGPGPTPPGPTPPITIEPDTIENNPQAVIDLINGSKPIDELKVNLPVGTTNVAVPGTIFNALDKNNPDAVLVISSAVGSYSLPVSAVNLQNLAAQLNVTSAELFINVTVLAVTTPTQVANGFDTLSSSIEFEVSVTGNGKTIVLDVFPQPVQRSITGTNPLDALTTVGVTVVDGIVRSVPTFVEANKKSANLYRAGNSTYTLVKYSKTFKDVDKGANWSEANIEKLASRMIVNGTTATTFDPNRAITRGEFAAILARGLGLVSTDSDVKFKDVSPKQAFNKNGEIAAVVNAGIATGYNHGEFRPYQEINRGEAAIMISKAINYIGQDKVTKDGSKHISSFKDYSKIGATMRPHVEKVLQAGYINGYSDNTYKSLNQANRAEVAKILYSFLKDIEFIN